MCHFIYYVATSVLLVASCLQYSSVAAHNVKVKGLKLCPEECSCYTNDDDVVVNCSTRYMEKIPTQMPLETSTLLLNYNRITEIPGYSFQKYSKLRFLGLHFIYDSVHYDKNHTVTIHNDSLLGLKKLDKFIITEHPSGFNWSRIIPLKLSCDKPFRDLSQLKYLEMGQFTVTTNQTCLDLAIRDLSNLQHLSIAWPTEELTHGLSFLKRLNILDLTRSRISVTRSNFAVLKELPLERLSLHKVRENYISSEFEPLALSELQYLEVVDLSWNKYGGETSKCPIYCRWTDILQSFQNTSTLHTLIMDSVTNFVPSPVQPFLRWPFSGELFAPLKQIKLVQLSFRCNGIAALGNSFGGKPVSYLGYLKYLEYVNVDYNFLKFGYSNWQNNVFIRQVVKGRIKELHVSNQYDVSHRTRICPFIPSDESLFLDTNTTRDTALSGPENEYELTRESHLGHSFTNGTVITVTLERLFMNHFPQMGVEFPYKGDVIRYLNKKILYFIKNYEVATKIEYVDLSSNSLHDLFTYPSIRLDYLKELKLENNFLQYLPYPLIKNLKKLLLFKNKFSSYGNQYGNVTKMFSNLNSMEHLDLTENMLEVLAEGMFENCSKLQTLKLAGNIIFKVDFLFSKLPNLKELDLRRNLLSGLNETEITDLEKIALSHSLTVKLDESRHLQCTCEYISFVKWIQDSERLTQIPNVSNLTCITLKGETVVLLEVNVHKLYLECINKDLLIGCIATITSVILVSLFLWYKRWTLKYWYYKHKVAKKAENADNERLPLMDYGAYVCYPEEDLEWASKIRQKLEEEMNLHLFFPARDFAVGGSICEEIVRGIETSRKILLCVNENYDDRGYQNFALQMSSVRGKGFIIPVIRGNIPVNRLPGVLRNLLRDDVYMDWPQDEADEEKFWKNLTKAIKTRKGVYFEKNGCGVYYYK